MTTTQRTEKATPLEKFVVLAGDLDQLRSRVEQITQTEQSIDDLCETLEVDEIGKRYGVSSNTMRKRLKQAGGQVFKIGKKHVIRKVRFLEVLEALESEY